jgi:hypothetical protein
VAEIPVAVWRSRECKANNSHSCIDSELENKQHTPPLPTMCPIRSQSPPPILPFPSDGADDQHVDLGIQLRTPVSIHLERNTYSSNGNLDIGNFLPRMREFAVHVGCEVAYF